MDSIEDRVGVDMNHPAVRSRDVRKREDKEESIVRRRSNRDIYARVSPVLAIHHRDMQRDIIDNYFAMHRTTRETRRRFLARDGYLLRHLSRSTSRQTEQRTSWRSYFHISAGYSRELVQLDAQQ